MVTIPELWLPILLSAILVFFAAALMWTVMPHHKKDWVRVPDEDALRAALRSQGIGRGQYAIPYATAEEMKGEEFQRRMEEGPVAFLVVSDPGMPAMPKRFAMHILYALIISAFVAYVAGRTHGPGGDYLSVFRIAGTVAFLAYAGALIPSAIFFARTWGSVLREVFDGAVYALITAGVFGKFWP